MDFNSRPSARGDKSHAPSLCAVWQFQFTPLREGRLVEICGNGTVPHFNSRPSARGDDCRNAKLDAEKFQFTPLREGRRRGAGVLAGCTHFNSRPSARGDGFGVCDGKGVGISIHAPPRGATEGLDAKKGTDAIFQFTPLREGRQASAEADAFSLNFNSRPSARGDSFMMFISAPQYDFNSRPSARGDEENSRPTRRRVISIHAPPRGATYTLMR